MLLLVVSFAVGKLGFDVVPLFSFPLCPQLNLE